MAEQANGATWNLDGVAISINGEAVGQADAAETLAEVVQRFSRSKGIQSATVYAGSRKMLPSEGGQSLTALGVRALNIVTKDQRAGA